ncbi:kinase-like protein [Fomitiporia mediterranea MF3/22]|uniref:kinase-like protein n=1 Tax=Fomitiporia mediterranea (strain MF3/22) TaxID=694068 RepID=UPI0004408A9F|nr:kinase-like protein [Fomitiporia mediterranea MF3/22]EJD08283.1 kinase-like protein [Fomitiporia mediterranea MF3/22]
MSGTSQEKEVKEPEAEGGATDSTISRLSSNVVFDGRSLAISQTSHILVGASEEIRYEKLDKVGTGFLADVYVYRKIVNGVPRGKVAVKQDRQEWVNRSAQEYERMMLDDLKLRLNESAFEYISRFYGKETIDNVPSLIFEYLEGGDVQEYVVNQPPSEEKEKKVVGWIRDMLVALVFIHSVDIVHRDVKPANFIRVDKEGSRVKLIDFGSAGHLEGRERTTISRGTFEYRSPEGHLDNKINEKADIFAIGLSTYEMLTGRQAFPRRPGEAVRDVKILDRIKNEEPVYDPEIINNYSREAFHFIKKLLVKNPAQRPDALMALDNDWFAKFDLDLVVQPGNCWWVSDEWNLWKAAKETMKKGVNPTSK